MTATLHRRAARITVAAAGCGVLVLLAPPAAAGVRGPAPSARTVAVPPAPAGRAAPATGPQRRGNRYNTGAPHSPQVLHQLADSPMGQGGPNSLPPDALHGIDIADYQHPHGASIDWTKVARAGIQFASIKATEGAYYKNPYALSDLAQARAAGLSVMAYSFAIPNGNGNSASPVAQADYLLSYLAKASGPTPAIMLDIEYDPYTRTDHTNECYGLSKPAMVTWITRFDAEVRARTGRDPVIYTPPPWWQKCTGGAANFRHVPVWIPDYSSGSHPIRAPGWRRWAFWQYTSSGTVNGIASRGHTDLDLLNPARIPLLDPGARVGVTGRAVHIQVGAADPVRGRRLSFTAAGLPPGIHIGVGGLITGRLRTAGLYRPTVHVKDGHGRFDAVLFPWTVRR
jgi:GH25 family lysozyme M1 (1,4-beta-N-acetylmuramidase)